MTWLIKIYIIAMICALTHFLPINQFLLKLFMFMNQLFLIIFLLRRNCNSPDFDSNDNSIMVTNDELTTIAECFQIENHGCSNATSPIMFVERN